MPRAPSDPSNTFFETHKGYDPRVLAFHFIIGLLLLTLAGGLAWQQLFHRELYHEREKLQSQRRILVPGPRGNIYDREGRLLVGNRARFAVTLFLDELRPEFRDTFYRIRNNYRATGDKDLPTGTQLEQIARYTVVQCYLDQINHLLGRHDQVDSRELNRHFDQALLLPYILVDDLEPGEYARLLEQLPVTSPLQLYTSSIRYYPYGPAAAHVLGYLKGNDDIDVAEDFPGQNLTTFTMKGTQGVNGLERQFDDKLQGTTGGTIYRVDPSGYRVEPPLEKRLPIQGQSVVTSLDIDLQLAAESSLKPGGVPVSGAAVALDVRTGEVLALASEPGYDLSDFVPHPSRETVAAIESSGAWTNRALRGCYPPGSTFKILTSIAALRCGAITPDEPIVNCDGVLQQYGRRFVCYNGLGHHGEVLLPEAIAKSCDIYFYAAGWRATPDVLAAEARRFHLDQPTGIELPFETSRMVIPDTAWKLRVRGEKWFPGDTANMAIGQGDVLVTPLDMACFAASVARGEIRTRPTILHRDDAPVQHSEPIGLTAGQRAAIIRGMIDVTTIGTARTISLPRLRIPGLEIAGKTGTAQIPGNKNVAWFICFAPAEDPRIAIAVAIEGDTAGEEYGGGSYAAPVARDILQVWWDKRSHVPARPISVSPQ